MNHPAMAGPRWHYSMHRFDELVYAMAAVDLMWDELAENRQRDLLNLLLPDVRDVFGCWAELTEPVQQFDRIDGVEALSIAQENGQRFPNAADALVHMQDQLRAEIATVISRWRNSSPAIRGGLSSVPMLGDSA